MSIESAIEEKIRQAIARGEFDNLAGQGKPIDLDAYFNAPEELRMAFSMLRSNHFVPAEIEMLKEIASLKEQIKNAADEEQKQALTKILHEKSLAVTLLLEKYRQKR